jgi:hypothetical protein
MSLVTRTPLALEIGHRALTNRVSPGHVWGAGMVYAYAVVLTGLNLAFWVGIPFNLPATWLMVLVTALLKRKG